MSQMTSNKPYLLRATWSWISDNELTPYLVVNAEKPNVLVPLEHVNNGIIVLNISDSATSMLNIANHEISFKASFKQVLQDLYIPMNAIKAIYAKENNEGMAFEDIDDDQPPEKKPSEPKKPTLKVIK